MLFHPTFHFSICPLPRDRERNFLLSYYRVWVERKLQLLYERQVRHAVLIPISHVLKGLGIAREHLTGNTLVSAKLTIRESQITHPLSNMTVFAFYIFAQGRGLSQNSAGQPRLGGAQKNLQLSQTPIVESHCDFFPSLPPPPPPHWTRFYYHVPDSPPTNT